MWRLSLTFSTQELRKARVNKLLFIGEDRNRAVRVILR